MCTYVLTKTACSVSKMALDGAPCGPSMKTSSGGRFLECVVTGRGIETAGSELTPVRYELPPLRESGNARPGFLQSSLFQTTLHTMVKQNHPGGNFIQQQFVTLREPFSHTLTLTLVHDFGRAVVEVAVRVVDVVLPVLRVEDDGEGVLQAAAQTLADFQDILLSVLRMECLVVLLLLLILVIWRDIDNGNKFFFYFGCGFSQRSFLMKESNRVALRPALQ